MMGPVMDNFLNHYQFPFAFPSLVRGQNTWDIFNFDFRNTQSPYIGEGWIDFFLHGELQYAGKGCQLDADNLEFSVAGSTLSQIVVSESAMTCIANRLTESNIGKVVLNTQTVSDLWDDPETVFTTSSLGKHFPIIEQKLGKDRPLTGMTTFKDVQVLFGSFDSDIIISYTVCLTLNLENGDEIIYDELRMVTSMKVVAEDDMVFITLLKHKLYIDNQYGQSTEPMRNGMKLTTNEYREFISSFGFYQNYLKKWLNNVYFKNGISFPYNPSELYTTLEFVEKQMHIMLEVEGNFGRFMEDEFWDEQARRDRDQGRMPID